MASVDAGTMSERARRTRLAKRLHDFVASADDTGVSHRDVVPRSLFELATRSLPAVARIVDVRAGISLGHAERALAPWDDASLESLRDFVTARFDRPVVLVVGPIDASLDARELAMVELATRVGAMRLYLDPAELPERRTTPRRRWPELPLVLRVFAGRTAIARRALRELSVGDAITLDEYAPTCPRARVDGLEHELVLAMDDRGFTVRSLARREESAMTELDPDEELVAVDDARVELRVEVARIVTTVAELEALVPGSVLAIEPDGPRVVTLRLAGQAVARGEIITVDGSPAVRIDRVASTDQ